MKELITNKGMIAFAIFMIAVTLFSSIMDGKKADVEDHIDTHKIIELNK